MVVVVAVVGLQLITLLRLALYQTAWPSLLVREGVAAFHPAPVAIIRAKMGGTPSYIGEENPISLVEELAQPVLVAAMP
ncbi:hypothetical protein NM74_07805 [Aeromonas hydrophila]|nr:hypothetical protein NM74_07805 [Aeromonas hydrophila]